MLRKIRQSNGLGWEVCSRFVSSVVSESTSERHSWVQSLF